MYKGHATHRMHSTPSKRCFPATNSARSHICVFKGLSSFLHILAHGKQTLGRVQHSRIPQGRFQVVYMFAPSRAPVTKAASVLSPACCEGPFMKRTLNGSLGVPSRPVTERRCATVTLRLSLLRLTRFQVPRCICNARGRSVLPWRSPATSFRSTRPAVTISTMGADPSSLWKHTSSNCGSTYSSDRGGLRFGRPSDPHMEPLIVACGPRCRQMRGCPNHWTS